MFEPYGPLPSAVYWRRRALGLGVLALLLASAGWGLSALVGGQPSPSRAVAQREQPPPAEPSRSAAPPAAGAQARPPTPPTCPDTAVRVSAEVPKKDHKAGQPVVFQLVVTNAGETACRRDTGALLRELIVSTPDGRRVWSSNDCHSSTTNETPLLQPGKTVRNKITWLGRTSEPGCPLNREVVDPGRYEVVAKLGKLSSKPVPFRLT